MLGAAAAQVECAFAGIRSRLALLHPAQQVGGRDAIGDARCMVFPVYYSFRSPVLMIMIFTVL